MELFKIFGKILLQGQDDVEEGLDSVSSKASGVSEKLLEGIGTLAKWSGAAIVAATGFATALTKSAVSSYAEYEQLAGGVETLFKDSSDQVKEYANNAYKTAGMSANEYMETVTSFSASLLQSLDGDTAAAAEKANLAITDMSDNANKMGTSMESIQNAYNGFAKQNYTMLDNLKLGYGGTKEEMERLLEDAEKLSGVKYDISSYGDIVDAIHVVQTEMGITGTTAEEAASTISGSIGMTKSAWQNLITGIADGNADINSLVTNFTDSAKSVAENIIPVAEQAISGIGTMVTELAPVISKALPELISKVLPGLLSAGKEMLSAIIDGIIETIPAILECLPAILDAIMEIMMAIAEAFPNLITAILDVLPDLIQTVINALLENLPTLIDCAVELFMAFVDAIPQFIPILIGALPQLITSLINGLLSHLGELVQGALQLFMALIDAIPLLIKALVPVIPDIVNAVVNTLIENFDVLLEGAIELFMALVDAIPEIISALADALPGVVTSVIDNLEEPIKEVFGDIWSNLKEGFTNAINTIKKIFSPLTNFFSGIWSSIKSIFSGVKEFFRSMFADAYNMIEKIFKPITNFFSGIWTGIKNIFSKVGEVVGNAIKSVVEKAVNGVLKSACKIINGFISAINGAIGIINKIPGVKISKLDKLDVPQLEKGGVLEKGQVGLLEGNGSEAVVPLDQNRKWISKVAEDMNTAVNGQDGNASNKTLEEILELIKAMYNNLPDVLTDSLSRGVKFDVDKREFGRLVRQVNA